VFHHHAAGLMREGAEPEKGQKYWQRETPGMREAGFQHQEHLT
jgi:hypothetical protein